MGICDDHPVVLEGLCALLATDPGLEIVGTARDADGAVSLANTTDPDVLLLDIMLPRVSGLVAAERIREARPAVRVLALTGSENPDVHVRLRGAGMAGCVSKRAPAGELLQAIRTVASGGTYVDSRLASSPGPPGPLQPGNPPLTPREESVARRLAGGHTNKEVAAMLGISVKTVETHRAKAFRKLGAHGRADLMRHALRRGWLDAAVSGHSD